MDTLSKEITFSVIPHWLLDADVSGEAYKLYGLLARYADNQTLESFPSRATLARKMGKGNRTIDKLISELKNAGALEVTNRNRSDGSKTSNKYRLMFSRPGYRVVEESNKDVPHAQNIAPPHAQNIAHGTAENCASLTRTTITKTNITKEKPNGSGSSEPSFDHEDLKPSKPVATKAKPSKDSYDEPFEIFWKKYPATNKGPKGDAKNAYSKLAKKVTPEGVAARLDHYIAMRRKVSATGDFVPNAPHVFRWFSKERWNDYREFKPGTSPEDNSQQPSIAPQELSTEEINHLLGPDNFSPPMPPLELPPKDQKAWRDQKIQEHLDERRKKALRKLNGN